MAVCIVYQHTKYHSLGNSTADGIRDFAFFLWTICVPMFFAISGYLFFRGFSISKLKGKWERRIKSLLFPYLIWNALYVAFMVILYKAGFIKELTIGIDLPGISRGILNAECSPLWFVRYLMLFMCIAPITYFILRKRILGALVITGMIVFNFYNYYTGGFDNGIHVNANTLVMFNYQFIFYATGAYAALCYSKFVETPGKTKSFIGLAGLAILCLIYWIYIRQHGNYVCNHLFRWIWIPLFWFAYDILPEIKVRPWMRFAFFIYCAHMFLIYCVQGITTRIYSSLGPVSRYFSFVEYLLLGLIVVFVLVKGAQIMAAKQSKLFTIVTGNRG